MKKFSIGVPKERKTKEGRVGMTPDGVRQILREGEQNGEVPFVYIEQGAGVLAGFSDESYLDAGAQLVHDTAYLYQLSDLIVKVKEPTPEEYPLLEYLRHKTLFTYLHLAGVDPKLTCELLRNEVTAIAYENVEQKKDGQRVFPLLVPMSEIAGTQAMRQGILYAREHACISPHVVIIGGGVVGGAALWEAINQRAASVSLFEMRKERVCELRKHYCSGNRSAFTKSSFMTMNTMRGKRGRDAFARADVVVSGVMNPGGSEAPKVLTVAHFAQMKRGCYIVDVAIDQGGSTEWSHPTYPGETFEREGLIFSCVANIPGSTVPREATIALTSATLPYIRLFAQYMRHSQSVSGGEWRLLNEYLDLRRGLQTWRGSLVNSFVAAKFQIFGIYKPLDSFFDL
jgi:alanine dehydrogenase